MRLPIIWMKLMNRQIRNKNYSYYVAHITDVNQKIQIQFQSQFSHNRNFLIRHTLTINPALFITGGTDTPGVGQLI